MATNLTTYVNVSAIDQDRATQPGNYILLDNINDKLIFTAGSAVVAGGQDTPTTNELNSAATIIQVTETEISTLLLLDASDVGLELKEVSLFGSNDAQYAINFSFDNATASEPTLELWDDNTHTSANLNVLGSGTPAQSMFSGILTTGALPGASWVGTPLAGGVAPNILLLNGGAGPLLAASDVYVNIKIVIPPAYLTPFTESPVITTRFTFA